MSLLAPRRSMLRFLALPLALVAALPAAAQTPPATILGVWAPNAESCTNQPGIVADDRFLIARRTVEDFVTIMSVQRWQRVRSTWRARAIVTGEEGGEEPSLARVTIELRLLPDGRLSLRRGGDPQLMVRCPPGIRVR